jgi:hypothetical protein
MALPFRCCGWVVRSSFDPERRLVVLVVFRVAFGLAVQFVLEVAQGAEGPVVGSWLASRAAAGHVSHPRTS